MIICDTNIWYDIGEEKISIEFLHGKPLVCTYTSLREIASKKDIRKAIKAIEAINKYASFFYFEDAFSIMLNKLKLPFQNKSLDHKIEIWYQLKSLLSLTENQITDIDNKIKEDSKSGSIIDSSTYLDAKNATIKINEMLSAVKVNIKKNKLQKQRIAEDTTLQTRELIASFLNGYLEEKGQEKRVINLTDNNWSSLELIIQVWSDFYKKLELNRNNKKIKTDDFTDMFNMAYVNSNDSYWTADTEWIKIMNENPKLTKYQFQFN